MKNKKLIAVAAAICAAILIGVIVISQVAGNTGRAHSSDEPAATSSGEEAVISAPAADGESEGWEEPANGEPEDGEPDGDSAPGLPDNQTNTDEAADPKAGGITFPYVIPNTGLTIQNITSYDGIFLEDGSDSSVSGICSIILKNTGSTDVEFARITLRCNDTPLTFELSDLPSGAFIVAQESNQTAYQDGAYRDCSADVAEIDGLEQSAGQISVQENGDGSLTVSNLTDSLIPCVRIFYKFYLSDEDVYVGGITYTAKLTDLEAGGSQTIIPSHYSRGYSKVVMVRTYDSQE